MVDIDALTKGIGLFGSALSILERGVDLLPDGSRKAEAQIALQRAEREFKLAEAESATQLGYEICRKHFPPQVMLSEDDKVWTCPECGNEKDKTRKASFSVKRSRPIG
ncbi:MAG: hypothetical protein GF383_16880 [Candidatus Lokiarchaeota archaeon]|nr:hypothetical protein [Candidatus Lokiarchaeota archaeon]